MSAIDLFCGAGGLSAGFVQEGYDVALGIDFEPAAVETFAANFGQERAEHADLLEFTSKDVRRRVGGDIDVILGGPSCQPFSTHGRHHRWVVGDPRSDLWSRMHSYVEDLRPKAFLMENVPGMLYYEQGTFVGALVDAFRKLGYTLTFELVLAADYNVPQLRRRLIVVGMRGEVPFVFPQPPRLGGWRRDSLAKWERERIARNLLPHITLRQALGTLPAAVDPGSPARYVSSSAAGEYDAYMRTPWKDVGSSAKVSRRMIVRDHERVPIIQEVQNLAKHVPQGGTWRDIPPHLLPERFRSMRRTDSTNLYGRMIWDRPAYTMTTQFQNITTGCFIHPDEDRPLTVREGARVQSFSDDFHFVGSVGAQIKLIGNAVPPLLARALARQLAQQLNGTDATAQPLVVGPQDYRGVPVPGGAEAAGVMRSGGKHDDAAKIRIIDQLASLPLAVEPHYLVEEAGVEADMAIPERKIAVFVQGCFIYGCQDCARGTKSQTWWKADIKRRVTERSLQNVALEKAGWKVVIVWEHEDPASIAGRLPLDDEAA